MALAAATDHADKTCAVFAEKTAANSRNIYPERWLRRKPVFPHEQIYRSTLLESLESGAFSTLGERSPVRIQLAYVEPGHPVVWTALSALRAYRARRRAGQLHGPELPATGLGGEVITAQDAESLGELVDHVLSSSASPPVTPVSRRSGRVYLDGSLVDAVPVRALSAGAQRGKVIVLLNSPIPEQWCPNSRQRLYLAPPKRLPIHKWDYTCPKRVRAAVARGRADAEQCRSRVASFLAAAS
jgi:hypothetical protein